MSCAPREDGTGRSASGGQRLYLARDPFGFLILAVGFDKGTSTVLGLIAFGAIFLFVRVYGESEEP